MISGNPFDVMGAISAGMRDAWVKRSTKAIFDPWEFELTVTVGVLTELPEALTLSVSPSQPDLDSFNQELPGISLRQIRPKLEFPALWD